MRGLLQLIGLTLILAGTGTVLALPIPAEYIGLTLGWGSLSLAIGHFSQENKQ